MRVTSAPYTLNHIVSRASDSCTVADPPKVNRVDLMPFPTSLLNFAHGQGSNALRSVSKWGCYGLDRIHSEIYVPHPSIALDNSNAPYVFQQYFQGGNDAESALNIIEQQNRTEWTGTRHNSTLTAHDTIRETPGHPGFFTGISMQGLLWHIDLSGRSFTAAGRDMEPGVIPRRDGSNRRIVGLFPEGFWRGPCDFAFDPVDDHLIYVADTFNDRITVTDGHDRPPLGPVTRNWVSLPKDFRPFSIEFFGEEMFVCGRGRTRLITSGPNQGEREWIPGTGGLIAIHLQTKVIRDISGGIIWESPQVIRRDENGEAVIATVNDMNFWRYNEQTGTRTLIHRVINPLGEQVVRPNLWVWLWIDTTGSCGPVGEIIYTSGGNNFGPVRIRNTHQPPVTNPDGVKPKYPGLTAFQGNGKANSGMTLIQGTPGGTYGWGVIGSDSYPMIIHAPVAAMGHRLFNYVGELDGQGANHPLNKYDEQTRQRGETLWGNSSAPSEAHPNGLPSIALLHGYMGETGLDILHAAADGAVYPAGNAEQLIQMPWAELAAFLRTGSGGTRPRTLTDEQIRDIRYYLKTMTMHMMRNTKVDPIGHSYTWIYDPAAPYFANATVFLQDVTLTWRHAERTRGPAYTKYLVRRTRMDAVVPATWLETPITDISVVDHIDTPGRYRYHVYTEDSTGRRSIGVPVPKIVEIGSEPPPVTKTLWTPSSFALGRVDAS